MCGGRGVAGGGCFRRVAWAILETGSSGWGDRLRNAALGSPLTKDTTVVALWSQGTDFLKIIKKSFFLTWVDVWDQLVSMLFASLAMRVLVLIPIRCVWVIPEDVLSKITLVQLLIKEQNFTQITPRVPGEIWNLDTWPNQHPGTNGVLAKISEISHKSTAFPFRLVQ